MTPRATWRCMLRSMTCIALSIVSWLTSPRRTSKPESAQTWAMPLPICPAPMTPIFCIANASLLLTRGCFRPAILHRYFAADPSSLFRECRLELGQHLEEIADQAIVGDLEDRRFFVLVDGDDDLRVLHAGEMLDRTRDAD